MGAARPSEATAMTAGGGDSGVVCSEGSSGLIGGLNDRSVGCVDALKGLPGASLGRESQKSPEPETSPVRYKYWNNGLGDL